MSSEKKILSLGVTRRLPAGRLQGRDRCRVGDSHPRTENRAGNTPARPANVTSAGGSPGKVQPPLSHPGPPASRGASKEEEARERGEVPRAAHFAAGPRRPRAEHPGRTRVRGGWGGSARLPGVGKAQAPGGEGRGGEPAPSPGGGARSPAVGASDASGGRAGAQMLRRRRGARAAREEPREAPGAHPLGVEPQVSTPAGTRAHWRRLLGSPALSRSWFVFLYLGLFFSFRRG